MSWKIPTWGDGIGAIVGSIPKIIKYFKDKGRVNEVTKISNEVDSNNDAAINKRLRDISEAERRRKQADS